jgi:lipopolysaccharide transport system ATP-binding protein
MTSPIIRVENLSKLYRLGKKDERSPTLIQALGRFARAPLENYRRLHSLTHFDDADKADDILWALRDISFEIRQGAVVGIIGRNGAGKSTLLKILSRIMPPTFGQAEIHGRLVSLLEVGTGFHPELSGRENVFLNGAILGMTRREILTKFDEIVAFAEIEKFIDTPVKRYSSGMYVRLAFAVAAHLEPEILIVDEVLAVGDAAFQQKCLGRMGKVAREGRTVLFVSHNMQAVSVLCEEAIMLNGGRIVATGPTKQVVDKYLSVGAHRKAEVSWPFHSAPHGDFIRLHSVKVEDRTGQVSYDQHCGEPIRLTMEFWCQRDTKVIPSFHLYNQSSVMVFATGTLHIEELAKNIYSTGLHRCTCTIPAALLNSGTFSVNVFLGRETDGFPFVQVNDAVSFQVIDDGTGQGDAYTAGEWPGVIRPLLPWTGEKISGQLPS